MANIDTKHYSDVNSAVETFSDILVSAAKESIVFKAYKRQNKHKRKKFEWMKTVST